MKLMYQPCGIEPALDPITAAIFWRSKADRLLKVDIEIHDENGNPQIATEDNPANVPVNGDFDEEKQVNGRYVRDYEDAPLLKTAGPGATIQTDDLRRCFVDFPDMSDDFWQSATLKIRKKAGVIDPATNEEEAGEIRLHALDASDQWKEISLDTDLAPQFFVSTGQYANYETWWMEGIKDGPITIELEVVINGGTPILVEKKAMICTEKTKAEWVDEVYSDIQLVFDVDMNQFYPAIDFRQNTDQLTGIYEYYAELYYRDTVNFQWPGMAKLAGGAVYGGLSDISYGTNRTTGDVIWRVLFENTILAFVQTLNLAPTDDLIEEFFDELRLRTLEANLMDMAQDVFLDIAWQFKAYYTSGFCALEYADESGNGVLGRYLEDGWENIRDGEILAGNKELLFREQAETLASGFSTLSNQDWGGLFSFKAENPIPTGPDFSEVEPDGDITDFTDRWNWVSEASNSSLNLWNGASDVTKSDWVSNPLKDEAARHALLPVR